MTTVRIFSNEIMRNEFPIFHRILITNAVMEKMIETEQRARIYANTQSLVISRMHRR